MASAQLTVISLAMFFSLIAYFVLGIIIFRKKDLGEKARKTFGGLLLGLSILNFVLFNVFAFQSFLFKPGEFVSIVLFFIIPFVEGMVFLASKDVKAKIRKLFGVLLILLIFVWAAVALFL